MYIIISLNNWRPYVYKDLEYCTNTVPLKYSCRIEYLKTVDRNRRRV